MATASGPHASDLKASALSSPDEKSSSTVHPRSHGPVPLQVVAPARLGPWKPSLRNREDRCLLHIRTEFQDCGFGILPKERNYLTTMLFRPCYSAPGPQGTLDKVEPRGSREVHPCPWPTFSTGQSTSRRSKHQQKTALDFSLVSLIDSILTVQSPPPRPYIIAKLDWNEL